MSCAKSNHKPIKQMSKKLSAELIVYRDLREVFLKKNPICPVTKQKATQIHHKKGRGKFLNVVEFWLAVSAEGHEKIEANPKWAKEMGYTLLRV